RPPPPTSTLFPYTTLFRSVLHSWSHCDFPSSRTCSSGTDIISLTRSEENVDATRNLSLTTSHSTYFLKARLAMTFTLRPCCSASLVSLSIVSISKWKVKVFDLTRRDRFEEDKVLNPL